MGKHTPGPWSADKWALGYTVSAPESHYSVCHLEDCNNDEANAHLIAAAPELLKACKCALWSLEAQNRHICDDGTPTKPARMLREAIAKAEGKP